MSSDQMDRQRDPLYRARDSRIVRVDAGALGDVTPGAVVELARVTADDDVTITVSSARRGPIGTRIGSLSIVTRASGGASISRELDVPPQGISAHVPSGQTTVSLTVDLGVPPGSILYGTASPGRPVLLPQPTEERQLPAGVTTITVPAWTVAASLQVLEGAVAGTPGGTAVTAVDGPISLPVVAGGVSFDAGALPATVAITWTVCV